MGTTSLAKVICGWDEFATLAEGACAVTVVAISIAKASTISARRMSRATGSDFRKDVIALPPRPSGQSSGRADFLSETGISQRYYIQFIT